MLRSRASAQGAAIRWALCRMRTLRGSPATAADRRPGSGPGLPALRASLAAIVTPAVAGADRPGIRNAPRPRGATSPTRATKNPSPASAAPSVSTNGFPAVPARTRAASRPRRCTRRTGRAVVEAVAAGLAPRRADAARPRGEGPGQSSRRAHSRRSRAPRARRSRRLERSRPRAAGRVGQAAARTAVTAAV